MGVLVLVTILQVGLFVALMLVIGRKALPWFLGQVVRTGSRELFTLTIVVFAIGIAVAAAELFNVSFALGAFFAGMVIRESPLRLPRGSRLLAVARHVRCAVLRIGGDALRLQASCWTIR